MRTSTVVTALGAATLAVAQRPNGTSICDYYSNALFNSTSGKTEYTLLTALVNTAVIGNYSVGKNAVTGILNKGTYNGNEVNLLPYFDGELASSNRGGSSGVSINLLDGGGAAPLMKGMAANDSSSNQYFLLTHLYEYFGALLGCSAYGKADFPAYDSVESMYEVHKFMDLDVNEFGYFVSQVGAAAASFGVAADDIEVVATALNSLFGHRCSPPTSILPAEKPELQAICIDESCPIAPSATCSLYAAATKPASSASSNCYTAKPTSSPLPIMIGTAPMTYPMSNATATMGGAKPTGGMDGAMPTGGMATGSMTGSSAAPMQTTSGATATGVSAFLGAVGMVMFALTL